MKSAKKFVVIAGMTIAVALLIFAGERLMKRFEQRQRVAIRHGWVSLQDGWTASVPYLFGSKIWTKRPPYEFTDRERKLIEDARARIPAIRHGSAQLTLLTEDGQPLPAGWRVEYKLIRHDFLFGTIDPPYPERERARHQLSTNLALIYATWNDIDPSVEPGYDWRMPEVFQARAWRRAAGYKTCLHTVAWNIYMKKDGDRVETRMPEYFFRDVPPEKINDAFLDHIRAMAEYSRGKFDMVNLWNEPVNVWANAMQWDLQTELLPMVKQACAEFRRINPDCEILLNLGEPIFAQELTHGTTFVDWLRNNDVEVDWVGLQFWHNGFYPWDQPIEYASLEQMHDSIERYSYFGYPLYITEFAAPSRGAAHEGWDWNEERQADFAEAMAIMAYGSSGIKGFNYYNTIDAFMKSGGLINNDGSDRESLRRLGTLYDSWTTRGETKTDGEGALSIRGTAGDYHITATSPDGGSTRFYTFKMAPKISTSGRLHPQIPPDTAPEPYDRLAPLHLRDQILNVGMSRIDESLLGQEDIPGGEFTHASHPFMQYELNRISPLEFEISQPLGFSLLSLPDQDGEVAFDLKTEFDGGGYNYIQVIAGEKRFFAENILNGCWRFRFPITAGVKPCIYTRWLTGEGRVTLVRPQFIPATR